MLDQGDLDDVFDHVPIPNLRDINTPLFEASSEDESIPDEPGSAVHVDLEDADIEEELQEAQIEEIAIAH
jgi:hypothetical protein